MILVNYLIVSVATSFMILIVIYAYYYIKEKQTCIGTSLLGWIMFFIRSMISFSTHSVQNITILNTIQNITFICGVFFIIISVYIFSNKPYPKLFLVIMVFVISYAASGSLWNFSYLINIVPLYCCVSIICIWTGIDIFRSHETDFPGKDIIGCLFIIYSLHSVCYPFLSTSENLNVSSYILDSIFSIFLSCSIILISVDRLKNQLYDNMEHHTKFLKHLPVAIFYSINSCIIYTNSAGVHLLGSSDISEIIGKKMIDFLHPDCKAEALEKKQQLIHSNIEALNGEFKLICVDGKTVDVEITASKYIHENEPLFLTVVKNITEKKQAELLKKSVEEKDKMIEHAIELDKLKTDFFANISHELRTPLNVILSSLQMGYLHLKNSNLHPDTTRKISKYSNFIRQNSYRVLKLVNNLIDITKLDTGYLNINLKNHNIISIVEDITLSVSEYIKNKGIYLQFDTDVEEKIIACDPEMIERIMLNLLSNAAKFTPVGGDIKVNIFDEGEKINISIKDSGIGIPHDKLGIIFERFGQINSSLSRNHEGSGIGLSLVKSLVEKHNGNISVQSEYNKGSEFIIELPAITLNEDTVMENQQAYTSSSLDNRVERINIEFSDIYSTIV